jgi:COMPASS component SWD2
MTSLLSPSSSSGFSFPAAPAAPALKLTSSLLTHFGVGRKHQSPGCINSLDFSLKGDSLVLSTDEPDESIQLFNVATAAQKKQVFCKKSGCDLVRFTHHPSSLLVCSKNAAWDNSIRYLSMHDNRYLRYFKGHRERVTALSMSPLDDSFLSASYDRTLRLWDLRTNVCQGLMTLEQGKPSNPGEILVAHDPAG